MENTAGEESIQSVDNVIAKDSDDKVIFVENLDEDLKNDPRLLEIATALSALDKEFVTKVQELSQGYEGLQVSVKTFFSIKG